MESSLISETVPGVTANGVTLVGSVSHVLRIPASRAVGRSKPKKGDVTMRMLLIVRLHHETFNAAVRDGSGGTKTKAIIDEIKPEAVYFSETSGRRTIFMIVQLENPSMIPALAEPWFLTFNADVEFHVVMSPEDLQKAGLEKLGEKWG
jgi:hypothetical protein